MTRILLASCALLLLALHARAEPFEVTVDQARREFRYTGTFTLREPLTNKILGQYQFVTGGLGRGSAPFGKYEVGEFQGLDFDPLHIGERWLVHHISAPDGYAWDLKLEDWRTELELHMLHAGRMKATLGCFGIDGGSKVYADFMKNLRYLIAWLGTVSFEVKASEPVAIAIGAK